MKLLLIGVMVNPKNVSHHPGISPATNKWQFDFLRSFKNKDCEVKTISYISEPYWPKGKLCPKITADDVEGLNSIGSFTYLNIAVLREVFIYLKMKKIVSSVLKKYPFDYLVTFNSLTRNNLIGSFTQNTLKKKWLSIIGDGDINPRPDIVIIQNYLSFQNYHLPNKYLYEGGVPEFITDESRYLKKNLVFTGTVTALTGIEKFAEEFGELNMDGIELDIYGRGDFSKLNKLAEKYSNINVHGYVSYEELKNAMKSAYAFINPRNEASEENLNTFPSKILEYIAYGKPMISTDSKSFKEEFRNILFTYNSDDRESMRAVLDKVRSLSYDDLAMLRKKLQRFAEDNSWAAISEKLLIKLNS